jgi:hypothetical protein
MTTTNRSTTCRSGLTLVELALGLIVLTIVVGALSAVTLAVSQGWQQSDDAMAEMLAGQHGVSALARTLRQAKMIGTYRPGSLDGTTAPAEAATVVIWKGDANEDGLIQFGEVAVIEFDPRDDPEHGPNVKIYEPPPTTPPAVADQVVGPEFVNAPTAPEDIKANPSVAAAPPRVLAGHVGAVEFAAPPVAAGQTSPAAFDFAMKVRHKDGDGKWRERVRAGTAKLRGPGSGRGLED